MADIDDHKVGDDARANLPSQAEEDARLAVERVQTGFRIEKRMLKVLKAMAEYQDKTLSELMEDIILHAFEGNGASAFGEKSLERIAQFKKIYGMDYETHAISRSVPKGKTKKNT